MSSESEVQINQITNVYNIRNNKRKKTEMDENNNKANQQNTRFGGIQLAPGTKVKRQASTQHQKERGNKFHSTSANAINQSASPFRKLNDEEVFITRETEKQKRKEAKEHAKNLKIWDKKTSTSRMPLRKVKDGDIAPAQMEDNIYNFNSEQRGYISSAMHIAKSRVTFSREQQMRPQNIKEFIEQKKEMFLVELSFNTVKKEITELDHKQTRKQAAIKDSTVQLASDKQKLNKFIEKDQIKMNQAENEANKAAKACLALKEDFKDLENKINNVKSDINKNKDTLSALEDHKKFLLALSESSNAKWVEEQRTKKKLRRDQIKRKWIDEHKRDTRDDHIIFRTENDLFSLEEYARGAVSITDESEKGQVSTSNLPAGGATGLFKQKKNNALQFQQLKRENMNDKDWEAKFEMLFAEDLIQIDDDFFDEELCFNDPNDLNEIFTNLEEDNLYLISQSQDLEESLEKSSQQYVDLQRELGSEIELHKKNKAYLNDQIQESQKQLRELKLRNQMTTVQTQSTASNPSDKNAAVEMEFNIEDLLNDLRADICRVYDKNTPPEKQPKQTLDILTEIECQIQDFINLLGYIEKIDLEQVKNNEYFQRALNKKKNTEKQLAMDEALANAKKEAFDARMDKVYKLEGRKPVERSKKPEVKREVVVVKIDQETLDRQRYLGEAIPDPNQMIAGQKKQGAAWKTNS